MSRRWLFGGLLLVAVVVAFTARDVATDDAVDQNNGGQFRFVEATPRGELIDPADRGAAPPFAGNLLDGDGFDSASLAGSVAVLNFWGSWCAPCRVEMPQFQAVYDEVRDDDVQFLGINVKDGDQLARAFVEDEQITFPSLFDPRGEFSLAFRDYPPNAIPSTILLDREGAVAAVYVGAIQDDDLRRAIETLLAEG